MVTKLTVRLPDEVAQRLRKKSEHEGTSLNEAIVRAVCRELGGEAPDEWWRVLGDLVERPPAGRFDLEELRRFHAQLPPSSRSIDEDLEWIRQDRNL